MRNWGTTNKRTKNDENTHTILVSNAMLIAYETVMHFVLWLFSVHIGEFNANNIGFKRIRATCMHMHNAAMKHVYCTFTTATFYWFSVISHMNEKTKTDWETNKTVRNPNRFNVIELFSLFSLYKYSFPFHTLLHSSVMYEWTPHLLISNVGFLLFSFLLLFLHFYTYNVVRQYAARMHSVDIRFLVRCLQLHICRTELVNTDYLIVVILDSIHIISI